MPYTRITHTRNGREALNYALNGQGHDGSEKRNLLVGTVGLLPEQSMPYTDQMEQLWAKASSKNKTQVRRLIASFSLDELEPNDPRSAEIALQIMTDVLNESYSGFPAVIAVQNDGKGGKLHVHAVACNVNAETLKGFSDEQTKSWYLEKHFDAIAERYIELDKGKVAKDKVTQNERRQRAQNEEITKQNAELPADQQKPLQYIWKDDLKTRISAAMGEAKDREDFLKRLTAHGVEGTYRSSKKQGDYILYELTDTSGFDGKIPQNLKSKSYKLGADFGCEALDAALAKGRYSAKTAPAKTTTQKPAKDLAKEADEKKKMQEFWDWCSAQGLSWYGDGGMDFDAYDAAKAAYEEYLKHPEKPKKQADAGKAESVKPQTAEGEKQSRIARNEVMRTKIQRDAQLIGTGQRAGGTRRRDDALFCHADEIEQAARQRQDDMEFT